MEINDKVTLSDKAYRNLVLDMLVKIESSNRAIINLIVATQEYENPDEILTKVYETLPVESALIWQDIIESYHGM